MSSISISVGLATAYDPLALVLPPPAPGDSPLEIRPTLNRQLEIVAGPGPVLLTVSGGTVYDGTYVIDPQAVQAGPVNLVAPVILAPADPQPGVRLEIQPGLWAHSGSGTALEYQTNAQSAVEDANTATPSLLLVPQDAQINLTVTERFSDSNGERVQISNSIQIGGETI